MFSFHSQYFVYRGTKNRQKAPQKLSFCFKCPGTGTVRILGNILQSTCNLYSRLFTGNPGSPIVSSFLHSIYYVGNILLHSIYYVGKMKQTIFPTQYILCRKDEADYFFRNFVCILRTTITPYMVSFIDFYFHFLANFQT